MEKRKSIGKKLRFETFKRDGFKCQYCGQSPPAVILEVDHIHPVSKGGDNDSGNLITACFDCNRGKSKNLLSTIPQSLAEKTTKELELEEQLKGIKKLKAAKRRRIAKDIKMIDDAFKVYFPERQLTESFKLNIKNQFLPKLDAETLTEHMETACNAVDGADNAVKYFCGINWRVIKGD